MNSPFCVWLAGVEAAFWRMIRGVFHFAFVHLPRTCYRALVEIIGPVAVRLARVSLAFGLWLAVLFGPCFGLVALGGFLAGVTWLLLALTGSVWGLSRVIKLHRAAA
jgi:hypothetical protein